MSTFLIFYILYQYNMTCLNSIYLALRNIVFYLFISLFNINIFIINVRIKMLVVSLT